MYMKSKFSDITFTIEQFNVALVLKQIFPILFLLFFFISFSTIAFSQDISKDNYSGKWTENATWIDNSSPGVIDIIQDCMINGEVQHIGNLEFNDGDLIVNDTLIIFGNLILGNNADLTINPGGILIVYGDYTSGNQVIAVTGGYLVVTGNFVMLGADNMGSFDITSGAVYLLDPTPEIKVDTAYVSLSCSDADNYPDSCGYGNLDNLSSNPISTIFNSGAYSLDLSGPSTFCSGGSIILSVPNDGTNYQWYKNGVAIGGATLPFYTAADQGNYSLSFIIGTRLFTTGAIAVTVNPVPSAPVAGTIVQPTCALSTGSVMLNGLPAGNWIINPGGISGNSASTIISGLASGTYSYTITNTAECTSVESSYIVINLQPATPTVIVTNPESVCPPLTIDLTEPAVTAGSTAGLTYTYWSDAAATIAFGIPANALEGTYYIKGTNGSGCYDIKPVTATVNPEPTITGTQTNILCFGASSGAIDITAANGTTPYSYAWTGIGVVKTDEDQTGLAAGSYSVSVTDANSCISPTLQVTITETSALSGSITSQTDVSVFGGNDGTVIIEESGGTAPYLYKIDGGAYQTFGAFGNLSAGSYTVTIQDNSLCTFNVAVTIGQPASTLSGSIITITNVACSGTSTGGVTVAGSGGVTPYEYKLDAGSYQSSGIFGTLTAGSYVVTIRDASLATFDLSFTITQPSAAVGVSVTSQTNVLCYGSNTGSITVTGSGGLLPYKYKLNAGPYQDSGDFGSLTIGSHSVTVQDANLCTTIIPVTITGPDLISITYTKEDVSCPDVADGKITLTITGGTEPYSVIWSDGVTIVDRNNITAGTYSVDVTDFNGCTAKLDAVVGKKSSGNCIEIQEIITPNNDGFYDTWKIKNIELFPNAEVHVFNRWGKMVFSTKNIPANEWDGTFEGKLLPTDSYHYVLYLNDGSDPKSGVISIIR